MRIYGPVPSRRFGLSLGIDVLPRKTCSFDCTYCQVGPTDKLTSTLCDFYTIDEILGDVAEALEDGPKPDLITFAGSGEPTLYKSLGALIDGLRSQFDIPILLITNSSMLWRPDVADAVMKANILAPSLDAGDAVTYEKLNHPHGDISFEKLIDGLTSVTQRFEGEIRLEVMLVRGVNDSEKSLQAIADQLKKVRFDTLDINTPVRPPRPERGALPCFDDVLARAMEVFGPKARRIGQFEKRETSQNIGGRRFSDLDKDIRETLLRRPSTTEDIADALGLSREQVTRSLERLIEARLIVPLTDGENGYYRATSAHPKNWSV